MPLTREWMFVSVEEPPIRAELFNVEQLERHARWLAGANEIAKTHRPDTLLDRLDQNEEALVEAYDVVSDAAEKKRPIAPAAEWLLDNFYLVEEQIRSTRRLLPRRYSVELPQIASGPQAGLPRVTVWRSSLFRIRMAKLIR